MIPLFKKWARILLFFSSSLSFTSCCFSLLLSWLISCLISSSSTCCPGHFLIICFFIRQSFLFWVFSTRCERPLIAKEEQLRVCRLTRYCFRFWNCICSSLVNLNIRAFPLHELLLSFFYDFLDIVLKRVRIQRVCYDLINEQLIPMLASHWRFGNLPCFTSGMNSLASQSLIKNEYKSSDLRPLSWGIDFTDISRVFRTYV